MKTQLMHGLAKFSTRLVLIVVSVAIVFSAPVDGVDLL